MFNNKNWFLRIAKILIFCVSLFYLLIVDKAQAVDQQYNVVILGDINVQKNDFIKGFKYIDDEWLQFSYDKLNNCCSVKVKVTEQNKTVILYLWDTSGQKKYIPTFCNYISSANAFIILFDSSKSEVLPIEWIEFAKQINSKAHLFLVDLEKEKLPDKYYKQVNKFAYDQNIQYFSVSITNQSGMCNLICEIATKCLESNPQESHCNSDLKEKIPHKCIVF